MNRLDVSDESKILFERVTFSVQLCFWLAVHVWFLGRGVFSMKLARESMVGFQAARDLLKGGASIFKVPSLEDPSKMVRVRAPGEAMPHSPHVQNMAKANAPKGTMVRQLAVQHEKQ